MPVLFPCLLPNPLVYPPFHCLPSRTGSNKEKKSEGDSFVQVAVLDGDGDDDAGDEHHVRLLQIFFPDRIGSHYS